VDAIVRGMIVFFKFHDLGYYINKKSKWRAWYYFQFWP